MKSEFWEGGFFYPINALGLESLKYFRNSFYEHERTLGDQITYSSFAQLHLHFPWAYQLATHPPILEAIKSILGPNILVHGSTIFHKHPNDQKFVSWHQDSYRMELNSYEYVSAWIALEDSTRENGCLRVIKGTHKDIYTHELLPEKNNLLIRGSSIDVSGMENQVIDIELKAGQLSLHHVNLIHGSNPNISGQRRVGMAIRYITPQVSQGTPHHRVILAAGGYEGRHYEVLERAPEGTPEECIEKQKIAHAAYAQQVKFPKVD